MALHLNLHHEIDRQSRARQRDPFKIAILCGIVVATLMVVWYLAQAQKTSALTEQAAGMQSEWTKLEKEQQKAADREKQLHADMGVTDKLVAQIEARFYWAPVLERLLSIVPPEVQLTHFAGALTDDKTGNITIQIDGIAAGTEPRTVAEELRTALTSKLDTPAYKATTAFKSLDDGATTVRVAGNSWPTANFSIGITLTPAAAAKPAPARAPRAERNR